MLPRNAIATILTLTSLAAPPLPAESADLPFESTAPGETDRTSGPARSAAELLVADEAASGCYRQASASEPNPEPCDVFLRLTASRIDESLRQAAAHNNRGLIMAELGGLEAALADFEAALALAPALSAAEVNRGTLLLKMGLYPDALRAFENVIANDDAHRAAALFNRSFVYRALGELDLAAADLAAAAAIDAVSAEERQPISVQTGFPAEPSGPRQGMGDQPPE